MPELAPSVAALLAGAERRERFTNPDGRSTAAFERVWMQGRPHVVKYVHVDDDFALRASGDLGCRSTRAWAAGLLDSAPDLVDHAVVGAALGYGRNGWGAAVLMRDVSGELWPADGSVMPAEGHAAFLDHVAGFCAATWNWHDEGSSAPVLIPYAGRWMLFGHAAIDAELRRDHPERVARVAAEGWSRFAERVPEPVSGAVGELCHDPGPLVAALRRTPSCLLHGDVKASNAGRAPDGRTLLIDWSYVGEGPAAHELAWHLALDRERLSMSKEATIEAFRSALEGHGVDTAGWWERQLGLCLLGALVQFGWEKALGDAQELGWWVAAARDGLAWL